MWFIFLGPGMLSRPKVEVSHPQGSQQRSGSLVGFKQAWGIFFVRQSQNSRKYSPKSTDTGGFRSDFLVVVQRSAFGASFKTVIFPKSSFQRTLLRALVTPGANCPRVRSRHVSERVPGSSVSLSSSHIHVNVCRARKARHLNRHNSCCEINCNQLPEVSLLSRHVVVDPARRVN